MCAARSVRMAAATAIIACSKRLRLISRRASGAHSIQFNKIIIKNEKHFFKKFHFYCEKIGRLATRSSIDCNTNNKIKVNTEQAEQVPTVLIKNNKNDPPKKKKVLQKIEKSFL